MAYPEDELENQVRELLKKSDEELGKWARQTIERKMNQKKADLIVYGADQDLDQLSADDDPVDGGAGPQEPKLRANESWTGEDFDARVKQYMKQNRQEVEAYAAENSVSEYEAAMDLL